MKNKLIKNKKSINKKENKMKQRVLMTMVLCLAVTAAFAQKKAVSNAERLVKDAKPDYNEARTLIKGALADPETKDDAKTWYVAGQIEDAQFSAESTKQLLGQQPNEPVMYEALGKILPYFKKSYELDLLPDEKGKVKSKYAKNIKSTLSANHNYYLNGGAYYFEQKDYRKACEFFEQYMEISDLPFFAGEKIAERDSNFMIVQFYNAVAATQVGDSEFAIKSLKRAKDTPFRQDEMYQYLCYEYVQIKDSLNLEKTLEEGMKVFPDSSYYILNLINLYIYSDRHEKARDLLDIAISLDPNNSLLYQALGSVYETGFKDAAKAEENFKKSLELEPESAVALSNLGRVYHNQAVNKLSEANAITDSRKYAEEKAVAKGLFEKAKPYYEKAYKINPDERDYLIALRGIYYNLDMSKEFDEIEAKMNGQ
jgi:tetratricopeptide (TPR) repeat protein